MIHHHPNGPTLHIRRLEHTKRVKRPQDPKNPKTQSRPQIKGEAENELVGARPTPIEDEKLKLSYPDRSDKGSDKMRKPKKTGLRIEKAGWQKYLPPETPITPVETHIKCPRPKEQKRSGW